VNERGKEGGRERGREGEREGSITNLVPDIVHYEIGAHLDSGSLFILPPNAERPWKQSQHSKGRDVERSGERGWIAPIKSNNYSKLVTSNLIQA